MEELPQPNFQMDYPRLSPPKSKRRLIFLLILISFFLGLGGGILIDSCYYPQIKSILAKWKINLPEKKITTPITPSTPTLPPENQDYCPQTNQEEAVIEVVKKSSPAVVSVIITKDIPKLELYYEEPFKGFEEFFGFPFEFKIPQWRQGGTEKQEIGGGTAFFVSEDGMLITNAHVVSDKEAEYTVLTNDGKKYPAKVLARDNLRDLAFLKIEGGPFPTLKLGNSDALQIGQTVIAIGNALGEFKNTVSVGVISGLGRRVTAGGGGIIETLDDVIQTDAAINRGNSGGPLLNLKGEVIGVNFAMASGAENIGFAIPINQAKKDLEQVKKLGKIVFPFLGVRYVIVNEEIQKKNNLRVNYGALIVKGEKGESAIFPGSPAEKIGLREGDVILEFNGEKITSENPLAQIISKYNPGDKITLKVLREGQEKIFQVELGERGE